MNSPSQPLPPGPHESRVPSWPNRAILCLLFSPALTLLLIPFLLSREQNPDEEPAHDHLLRLVCIAILSGGYLVATAPLAARMAVGPHIATGLSGLVLILGMPFHSGLGSPGSWIVLGGLGMAWYGRSAFTRPWDPGNLLGWTLSGYKRLLAPDHWAALRLIAGIVLFLGGIAFMVAAGTALSSTIPISKPVAKFLAIPALLGGFLAASGLSLSENAPR